MVRYLITTCLFFILFACSDKYKTKTDVNNLIIYELNNKLVENEIIRYNDSISKHTKMINLAVWSLSDTICFEIRGVLNGSDIINKTSTFFVNTKIGIIAVSYVNPTIPFSEVDGVRVSEKESWDILKKYYPEEYESYLRKEVYPIITGGGVVWSFKFVSEKYVEKKIFIER
jgi:hypothetical protein